MKNVKEKIAIAKILFRKHGSISPITLQRHMQVTFKEGERIIKALIKDVCSAKKSLLGSKKKGAEMSVYEIKAHQRIAEVDMAQNLLNINRRSSNEGHDHQKQLEILVLELELIAKKPIIPVVNFEED